VLQCSQPFHIWHKHGKKQCVKYQGTSADLQFWSLIQTSTSTTSSHWWSDFDGTAVTTGTINGLYTYGRLIGGQWSSKRADCDQMHPTVSQQQTSSISPASTAKGYVTEWCLLHKLDWVTFKLWCFSLKCSMRSPLFIIICYSAVDVYCVEISRIYSTMHRYSM